MSKNYWWFEESMEYPQNENFDPKVKYAEYPYTELQEKISMNGDNLVYEAIRDILKTEEFDGKKLGTGEWNPLGYCIVPGNTVLLKPNLVNSRNLTEEKNQEYYHCTIVHPSIVRVIFDYVYIALKGEGKIIIADAPIQGCDFEKLLRDSGYGKLFQYFKEKETDSLKVDVADLRDTIVYLENGNKRQIDNKEKKYQGKVVDLGENSYFYNIRNKKNFRVTDYAAEDTVAHHSKGKNEYCVSEALLNADVVINIVKPKTHRIAGYTAALKNMIGINTRKEYLPHHQCGSKRTGGDEYIDSHLLLKFLNSRGNDVKNWALKRQYNHLSDVTNEFSRRIGRVLDHKETNRKKFGMWYGNDTIWRTILDVNHIVHYCDKTGIMQKEKQRKVLHFGDMVVSGEKEGPLNPTYKKVGGILFSDNPVAFDLCVVKLMGFDYKKFPTLVNALKDQKLFNEKLGDIELHSNNEDFNKKLKSINKNFGFEPASGWREFL